MKPAGFYAAHSFLAATALAVLLWALATLAGPPDLPQAPPGPTNGYRGRVPGISPYDALPRTTNIVLPRVKASLLPLRMWSKYPLDVAAGPFIPYAYKHHTTAESDWGFPAGVVEIKPLTNAPAGMAFIFECASYPYNCWYVVGRIPGPTNFSVFSIEIPQDSPTGFYRVRLCPVH